MDKHTHTQTHTHTHTHTHVQAHTFTHSSARSIIVPWLQQKGHVVDVPKHVPFLPYVREETAAQLLVFPLDAAKFSSCGRNDSVRTIIQKCKIEEAGSKVCVRVCVFGSRVVLLVHLRVVPQCLSCCFPCFRFVYMGMQFAAHISSRVSHA